MNHLPVFRHMVKAIGDKNFKKTAYRYNLLEFLPTGGFIRKQGVWYKDTAMRMDKDGNKRYEMQLAGDWRLVSADEFRQFKAVWDARRTELSLPPVDDFGNDVN